MDDDDTMDADYIEFCIQAEEESDRLVERYYEEGF